MEYFEVGFELVKSAFCETDEINVGFGADCSYLQIADGSSVAFAVIYDLNDNESDFIELARFFVPKEYRGKGFGRAAAVFIIRELFKLKSEILIDPLSNSVRFWGSVAKEFSGSVDFVDAVAPKYIWTKNNTYELSPCKGTKYIPSD
ncbi:GNAT family N-acetyltransferase [Ferrimonas kyonanensis]|uniref:GNAT family N-acetyltransferase n=1 Tax=Ferrimonas kyonanensis TaxID=364763 RepID=UPI00048086F4|nr:GNAT family N-acetyltransferase [Ferrimonas kyonanensis]